MKVRKILRAIEALKCIADDTEQNFTLQYKHKRWSEKIKVCTITIFNKSFTEAGEDCISKSVFACVKYAANTFSAYSNIKTAIEEKEKKENKYCSDGAFQIVKASSNLNA